MSNKCLEGEGVDVGLLGVVGNKDMLELGNKPDKVSTEKNASKTNGEVDSKTGEVFKT